MKKIIKNLKIISILSFILLSCENNENTPTEIQQIIIDNYSENIFVGAPVGHIENGELKLDLQDEKVITSFNNYSKTMNIGKKAISFELLTIHKKNYIRFHNSDDSASTIALLEANPKDYNLKINSKEVIIVNGGTVCTTRTCASCCGCVPNGNYCTLCEPAISDCQRTTSNEYF